MVYKNGWVLVNKVPTKVHTWGGWIEDRLPGDSLIIFITGNPGMSQFYNRFLSYIHQQLNVPVWITCHAGHEVPPPQCGMHMQLPEQPSLYDVEGQVDHKLALVRQYVPASCKLYLMGHSLGAKIVSNLLKNSQIAAQTQHCYMLMPTLEHIRLTPNGRFLSTLLSYFMTPILFFAWIFSLLPDQWRELLIRGWFNVTGQLKPDINCMEAICELTRPRVLRRVFTLALDEMNKIKDLDIEVLETHWSKMRILYAREDGWSPLSHMEHLRQVNPQLSTTVLGPQFNHTFVLENPEELANVLVEQIKNDITRSEG